MNAWQRFTALLGFGTKAAATQDSPPRDVPFTTDQQDGKTVDVTGPSAEDVTKEGLKNSSWVYIGATRIQRAVSSVPFKVQRREGETWEDDPEHPLNALLKRPNEFMNMGFVAGVWAYHMMLTGNALHWINTGGTVGGEPLELWPVLPDQIRPIKSRDEWLLGYLFNPTGQKKDETILERSQVVHWMFPDPQNLYWGMSPIQAVARAIDTDIAATRWNAKVLENGGMPPFVVMLDQSLTPEEAMEAQAVLHAQAGGVGKARKWLVLGGASKVQSLALNAQELDWLNGRKMAKEEIAGALGVPPILLVAGESVTYANLEGAKRLFWEDTALPLLTLFAEGLTQSLIPLYGQDPEEYRVYPDTSGVAELQGNVKTQAEAGKIFIDMGFPLNAVNRRLGLGFDDVEGGDTPRNPAPAPGIQPALPKSSRGPREGKADTESEEQRRERLMAQAKKAVAAFLDSEGSRVAAAFASGKLDLDERLNAQDWRDLLKAIHEAVLEAEGEIGYSALYRAIMGSAPEGAAFNVLSPNVISWIEEHTGEMVKLIDRTTRDDLKRLIAAEVEAGASTAVIRDKIRDKFTDWSDNRAALIARTEVNSAFGAAHQLSAEQLSEDLDVSLVKTWNSAGDARVRDEHADMDGETVGLDETFSNGYMFPSEPNCRCVVTYHEAGG